MRFLGFSFASCIPELGAEEAGNPEMPTDETKNILTKVCSLYPKEQEGGNLARHKTFRQ